MPYCWPAPGCYPYPYYDYYHHPHPCYPSWYYSCHGHFYADRCHRISSMNAYKSMEHYHRHLSDSYRHRAEDLRRSMSI